MHVLRRAPGRGRAATRTPRGSSSGRSSSGTWRSSPKKTCRRPQSTRSANSGDASSVWAACGVEPPDRHTAGRSPAAATASTNASAACRATATGSGSTVTFTLPGPSAAASAASNTASSARTSSARPSSVEASSIGSTTGCSVAPMPYARPTCTRARRSITNSDSAQRIATRSTCGPLAVLERDVRSRREPSQPASRRASLIGPWTSTACRPGRAAAAGGGSNSDAIALAPRLEPQPGQIGHGRLEPAHRGHALERRDVRVDDGRRGQRGPGRDSTASPGGIGPCHHTNVGRSVTSSDSTALGSASRRAVREDLLGAHLLHPAAEPARGRHGGAHAVGAGAGDDRPQRPAAADALERALGVGDVLGRRRVDDQVERGGAHRARAALAAGRERPLDLARGRSARRAGWRSRPPPAAPVARDQLERELGPPRPRLVHLRRPRPPLLEQRVADLPRALDAVLRA